MRVRKLNRNNNMNGLTDKLIRDLATKFGTTAEYLWSVMIKQAMISGVTNVIVIIAWIFIFRKAYKTILNIDDRNIKLLVLIVFGFICGGTVVIVSCNMVQIIGSFLNPEYWVLTQVLHN